MASIFSSNARWNGNQRSELNDRRFDLASADSVLLQGLAESERDRPDLVTLRVAVRATLDAVLQDAIDVLRVEHVHITAAAQILHAGELLIGRIVLRSASDKPRALEVLHAHHITAD